MWHLVWDKKAGSQVIKGFNCAIRVDKIVNYHFMKGVLHEGQLEQDQEYHYRYTQVH